MLCDDAGKRDGGTANCWRAGAESYGASDSYTADCASRKLGELEYLESMYGEGGDESGPWEDRVGESGGNETFWLVLDSLRSLCMHQLHWGQRGRAPSVE